jgi:hypothetical protein
MDAFNVRYWAIIDFTIATGYPPEGSWASRSVIDYLVENGVLIEPKLGSKWTVDLKLAYVLNKPRGDYE